MHRRSPRTPARFSTALAVALVAALSLPAVAPAAMRPTTAKKIAKIERKIDLKDAKIPYANGGLLAPQAATTGPNGDYRVDALLSGYAWTTTTVTYSFYADSVFGGAYYGSETGVREVSEPVKANVRAIMAWYSSVMNLNLVEVAETPSTVGQIRLLISSAPSYAYAYYPGGSAFSVGGDVHLNPTYDRLGDTNGFQHPAGQHGYLTLVHEIGHALGLKHSFDGAKVLPTAEDNTANTVMTYTFTGASPGTPMVYDLRALQHIYGSRAKNTGDDTYAFTSRGTSQYSLSGTTLINTTYQTKQTIWDTAGTDTLDASGLPAASVGYRFDLAGGGWMIGSAQYKTTYFDYGTSLAYTFAPENFVNSSSADTIWANGSANVIKGYSAGRSTGADVIYNAASDDTIDLSGYSSAQVTRATIGTDLFLGLGAYGTVTLKGYGAGNQPRLLFADSGNPPPPNEAPIARITASTASGVAPLAVTFSGNSSTDAEGAIASYAWDFADGSTATGVSASHTFTAPGVYPIRLTVTDADGATGSTTYGLTVNEPPAPTLTKIHVSSISLATATAKRGKLVRATVSLVDADGRAAGNAVVSGSFTGAVMGSTSGTSDSAGVAILNSGAIKKSGTVSFTVKGVTVPSGFSYDAAANAVTTAAITVAK